jgi:hypothetical protein
MLGLFESPQSLGVDCIAGRQHFDGNIPANSRIFRAINLTHSPGANHPSSR